jgi:hypothetical protein
LEVLRQAKDNYTVAAVRDGVLLHYDNHRDSAVEEQIGMEEGMVDSNVVDIDDEADDEHDYEVADCNDSQERNVDMVPHVVLAEQPVLHVLHLLHQGTFPLEGVYVSSVYQRRVEQDLQTGVANGHNRKSNVIFDV